MKKNGFTLVELLAVIVILAVVMLIAVTAVGPMMEKSRKGALGTEGLSLIDAADTSYTNESMKGFNSKFKPTSTVCFTMDYLCKNGFIEKGCGDDDYTGSVLVKRTPDGKYDYVFWISNGTYVYNAATKENYSNPETLGLLYEGKIASTDCGKTDPEGIPDEAKNINITYRQSGIIYVTDSGVTTGEGGDTPAPISDDPSTLFNIVKNLSLGSSSSFDYNIPSNVSGTNGVYEFAGNSNVYFYRGKVDNNVLFGGYCWKIIRTTSTGGVKLIYSGVPSGNTCNNEDDAVLIGRGPYNIDTVDGNMHTSILAPGFAGYTYNFRDVTDNVKNYVTNPDDEHDSKLKEMIDGWYASNMTSYTQYIEDTPYCNNRQKVAYDASKVRSGASVKSTNGCFEALYTAATDTKVLNPSLACSKEDSYTVSSSIGNGKLTYPVATITADELIMAGYGHGYKRDGTFLSPINPTAYLSEGSTFWTLTPMYYDATPHFLFFYAFIVNDSKGIESLQGARPVISLKSGMLVETGNGKANSPYKIKLS